MEKGDKLRAYHQIKGLQAQGNEIVLFCLSHEHVRKEWKEAIHPYCSAIYVARLSKAGSLMRTLGALLHNRSLQTAYWCSSKARRLFQQVEQRCKPDVVYNQMVRTMPIVQHSRHCKVMDFQDCLSLNMGRNMARYEISRPDDEKPRSNKHYYCHKTSLRYFVYHYEFKNLRKLENQAFSLFDALTIISEPDRAALPSPRRREVHIVPNGVDVGFYRPKEEEKKFDVAFCGNMQYEPNIRTAVYLAMQVMPLVWEERPEARLLIAGATPVAEVWRLASDRIEVRANVPDIRQCYASTKVFAAPMQSGSGLQNKLLEAMAMEIPCITSSLANSSLRAKANGQEILVGDTPRQVARHILYLLGSQQQRDILADNARHFVCTHYTWQAANSTLNAILASASSRTNDFASAPLSGMKNKS